VGARVEIYEFMNEITKAGATVVMASSDLPEVLGMSDRILVMNTGRIAGELSGAEATQDAVMSLAVRDLDAATGGADAVVDDDDPTPISPGAGVAPASFPPRPRRRLDASDAGAHPAPAMSRLSDQGEHR